MAPTLPLISILNGKDSKHYKIILVLLSGPKVRDHWEDLAAGGRITLRWTLGREGSMGRTGLG
jgi:hypothetical protein